MSHRVKCRLCGTVSDESEWRYISFYCDDCEDDHSGVKCPNDDCDCIDGPGRRGRDEVA